MEATNGFNKFWKHADGNSCPVVSSLSIPTAPEKEGTVDVPVGITLLHTKEVLSAKTERNLRRVLAKVFQIPLFRTEIFVEGVETYKNDANETDPSPGRPASARIGRTLEVHIVMILQRVTKEEAKRAIRNLNEAVTTGALNQMFKDQSIALEVSKAHIQPLEATGTDSRHIESEVWPLPPQTLVLDPLWPAASPPPPVPTTTAAPLPIQNPLTHAPEASALPPNAVPSSSDRAMRAATHASDSSRFRKSAETDVAAMGDDVEGLVEFLRDRFRTAMKKPDLSATERTLLMSNYQRMEGCLRDSGASPTDCIESSGVASTTTTTTTSGMDSQRRNDEDTELY